ncbi:MAG: GHMP kinase [Pyrinomonadaceae bacterium]
MNRASQRTEPELPDVTAFIEMVRTAPGFFDGASGDIFVTRAPGRLDVMGGIADYSGASMLELPIAEAAIAGLQRQKERRIKIKSLVADALDGNREFELPLDELETGGEPINYEAAQARFAHNPNDHWAAYIAGAFLVLMRERGVRFDEGARILLDSRVPEGKGVSSSAAIEVAAMSAIASAFDIELEPDEMARLCQMVENLIVAAPCGIMDQMSSVHGQANRLVLIGCQPAEMYRTLELPDELQLWGIDSGVRHSVGGGDYGAVRTGAFMGYRMIADLAGLTVEPSGQAGVVRINDPEWGGYLANLTPAEFESEFSQKLPKKITGKEFLARYQGITDTVTRINPEKRYAVLNPTRHPIHENERVTIFVALLQKSITEIRARSLGELMYAAHEGYNSCRRGSPETDRLVQLVKRSPELYGAKITGGGSGGTVAVLGRKGAGEAVNQVAREYEQQTGYQPYIFSGSSMGAAAFGHLRIDLKE